MIVPLVLKLLTARCIDIIQYRTNNSEYNMVDGITDNKHSYTGRFDNSDNYQKMYGGNSIHSGSANCPACPGVAGGPDDPCGGFSGKLVYLMSDTGYSLARCEKCGEGEYDNSVTVHGKERSLNAQWKLVPVGKYCTLKADNGMYASVCNGCWADSTYKEAVFLFLHDPIGYPDAMWTLEKMGDKQFAFKTQTGKYLGRCSSCVKNILNDYDASTAHSNTPVPWTLVLAE